MVCEEKQKLLDSCRSAAALYSYAVAEHMRAIADFAWRSFEVLRELADDAHLQEKHFLSELEEHMRLHGC